MPDNYHGAMVVCNDCELDGPSSLSLPDPDGCWMPDKASAEAMGIKAWNRRQQAPAERAEPVAVQRRGRIVGLEDLPVGTKLYAEPVGHTDLIALLREARFELVDGIETECTTEADHSKASRLLVARIDAALAKHEKNPVGQSTPSFQRRVQPWLMECFGELIAGDREERNHRFLEEALELVQSCDCTAEEAHKLVDYVYGRPVGEKSQEVGGVMVTLAALCLANGLNLYDAAETELARITQPAIMTKIREKQKRKPAMSPLPGSYPSRDPFTGTGRAAGAGQSERIRELEQFVQECAGAAGGMVNGNQLSIKALKLMSATDAALLDAESVTDGEPNP